MDSILIHSLSFDLDEIIDRTRRIRNLPKRELETRFENILPIMIEKEEYLESIMKDLLGERNFFEKIGVDYNNMNGYDVDCIRIALSEYFQENAKKKIKS